MVLTLLRDYLHVLQFLSELLWMNNILFEEKKMFFGFWMVAGYYSCYNALNNLLVLFSNKLTAAFCNRCDLMCNWLIFSESLTFFVCVMTKKKYEHCIFIYA